MAKIIGNTTVTPMTVPDFAQTDERKADYIKNKKISFLENDIGYAEKTYVDGKVGEIDEALESFIDKTKVTMHFLDAQNTLHTAKINTWMTWAEAIETEEVKALGMGFAIGDDGYVRCYISAFLKEADYEGDVSASTFPAWCIKGTDKVKDGQVYTSSGVYEMDIPTSGGTWELINTITVSPDADGSLPTNIIFSKDADGNDFELSSFYVNILGGFTDGTKSTLYAYVNGVSVASNATVSFVANDLRKAIVHYRQREDGFIECTVGASIGKASDTYWSAQSGISKSVLISPNDTEKYKTVTSVKLNTMLGDTKTWIAGSKFELYGVRK